MTSRLDRSYAKTYEALAAQPLTFSRLVRARLAAAAHAKGVFLAGLAEDAGKHHQTYRRKIDPTCSEPRPLSVSDVDEIAVEAGMLSPDVFDPVLLPGDDVELRRIQQNEQHDGEGFLAGGVEPNDVDAVVRARLLAQHLIQVADGGHLALTPIGHRVVGESFPAG